MHIIVTFFDENHQIELYFNVFIPQKAIFNRFLSFKKISKNTKKGQNNDDICAFLVASMASKLI